MEAKGQTMVEADTNVEKFQALIIPTDFGAPAVEALLSFREIQEAVGGLVQAVNIDLGEGLVVTMCANEEGMFLDLPVNEFASRLYGHQVIVGQVVLVGMSPDGDFGNLPTDLLYAIRSAYDDMRG